MTITITRSKNSAVGDGANDTFVYQFKIWASTDLVVLVNGVLQTLSTDYTVTGVGVDGGGTVVFQPGHIPGVVEVVIYRDVPKTQNTDYVANDPFPAQSHEDALDKLTHLVQQNRIYYGYAAPTSGTWERGDIVLFVSPAAGGKVGSVCTASGTPGTWKSFGAIDA